MQNINGISEDKAHAITLKLDLENTLRGLSVQTLRKWDGLASHSLTDKANTGGSRLLVNTVTSF